MHEGGLGPFSSDTTTGAGERDEKGDFDRQTAVPYDEVDLYIYSLGRIGRKPE